MFRPRRQARKNQLANYGFLPFEASALSAMSVHTAPFLRDMITERRILYKRAIKEGWSQDRYRNAIHLDYERNDWVVKDSPQFRARGKRLKSVGRDDVWSLVRYFRDAYKDKNQGYESPSKPKRRKHYDENDRRIDKGRLSEQRKRWKEKQRLKKQAGLL